MTQQMRVDFVADVVCPWCYLGWRKLQLALEARPEVEADIHWLPFQLRPDMPEGGMERMALMRSFMRSPEQIEESNVRMRALGEEVGLDMRPADIPWSPNTARAHRLMLWADQAGLLAPAIEALFKAYWTQLRDIGDVDVLADIAATIGMDAQEVRDRLASDLDEETVAAAQQMAARAGITGVPAFAFNRMIAAVGAEPPEVLAARMDQILAL